MSHDLFMVLVGVMFGLANVIPGVSGGTIAVVFGIYERLIGVIADFRHQWKKELRFLITFGLGAGIGILIFGKLMNWVLTNYPSLAQSFFIGVILGSIPMIAKKTLYQGKKLRVGVSNVLPGLITLGAMIVMAVMGTGDQSATEMTGSYFSQCVRLVIWGIVAMSCMIIPGISGSFVMLLLGTYTTITTAISEFNFVILIPIALGCAVGILGGAKVIKFLLQRYPQATYFTILGLVVGSIPVLLKNVFWEKGVFTFQFTPEFAVAIVTLLIGALLAYFLGSRVKEQAKPEKDTETC